MGDFILAVCPNPSVDIFAWINQLDRQKVNRFSKEERYPGGKGVHVALAAAEMGEEVRLLGFWGGPTGDWITKECEKRYGNLKCCGPKINDWSRSCYTFKSEGEFDETEILGLGPTLIDEDFDSFFRTYEDAVVDAKCVTISGSWPTNTTGDECFRLVNMAKRHNKATFIDCTGDQLIKALEAHPFTIHLNRSEVTSQFGKDNDQGIVQWLTDQCDWLALTDGANGLYLANGQQIIHGTVAIDQVFSAVGSGDCLLAGLAVALGRNLTDMETAKLGASCGAANCLRPELGLLYKQDVDRLYAQAQVRTLSNDAIFV